MSGNKRLLLALSQVVRRVLFVLAVLLADPVFAAARHLPPVAQLQDPLNLVVVGQASDRLGPSRFRFVEVELLSGNPQGLLREGAAVEESERGDPMASDPTRSWEVRMSGATAGRIRIGERYILGFTGYLKGRFPLPKLRRDPEGYRLVQLPVLEEALFPLAPELEFLLTTPSQTFHERPRPVLKRLMALLRGEPGIARRFAVMELTLRPRLYSSLKTKDLQYVRRFIEDASKETVERDYLLQGAWQFPSEGGEDWIAEAARTILAAAELEVDLSSSVPAFHHNALRTLKMRGDARDLKLVTRLLRSGSPGVALSAIRTLEELSPADAVREVGKALAEDGLPGQSMKYFESFLRRMRTMQQGTQPGPTH